MRKKCLLLLLLLFAKNNFGQHCGWDFSYLIIIHVHQEGKTKLIKNLDITLLDSLEQPVLIETYNPEDGTSRIDTVRFRINRPKKKSMHYPKNQYDTNFWFAEKNYIIITGKNSSDKNSFQKILVQDLDAVEGRRGYRSKIIKINKVDYFSLCTESNHWDLGKKKRFSQDVVIVDVELEKW